MQDDLLTVHARNRLPIGPLSLVELRERLRKDPAPDDSTLIIHTRLGDQVMLLGYHPTLRSSRIQPPDSVVCPHCDTIQPTCTPGERPCVRCGTNLIISDAYEATLGSDPKTFWYLSLPGIAGFLVFSKLYPSDLGLWTSILVAFGVPFVLMIRQGVAYGRGGKFTAREDPIFYTMALAIVGMFALLGLVLLIFTIRDL